jgi:hypothetical protein
MPSSGETERAAARIDAAGDRRPNGHDTHASALQEDFASWPDGRINGLFETEPPPVEWFCENRLLAGRAHVLAGLGGSSKTRLLYQLAVGAVTGRVPWGWEVARSGSAALFLTEDVAAQVHRALHRMGERLNLVDRERLYASLRVYPLAGLPAHLLKLDGQSLYESDVYFWLMSQLGALPKPIAFIGIDPALGVTEGDELSPAHQRRLGELIDRIAIESGACVMLSAHAAKGTMNADEPMSHTARGSGALTDAVRAEFVVRNMTADEARRFGISDVEERRRYLQLAAVKGNELPPEAFAPLWLKRGGGGFMEEATLEVVQRGTVGERENKALAILAAQAAQGDSSMQFWRERCIDAGVISKTATAGAQKKAMERIRDVLLSAGLIVNGRFRGSWIPAERDVAS